MLSENEKVKIELTEKYREEIRKKINKDGKTNSNISTILNSPIAIWFLSTVVVGLLSLSYTERQKKYAEEAEREGIIRKLDAEILSRLEEGNSSFWFIELASDTTQNILREVPSRVFNIPNLNKAIFPEYSNRDLRSLMYELESLVKEKEKSNVRLAIHQAELSKRMWLNRELTLKNYEDFDDAIKEIRVYRWDEITNIKNAIENLTGKEIDLESDKKNK
jgi:hypothetical protein